MKKSFTTVVSMIFVSILGLSFMSCSEKAKEGDLDKDGNYATIDYRPYIGADYLALADITITYIDGSGKEIEESITTEYWTKKITLTSSQKFGYVVNMVQKANIDELLVKNTYTLAYTLNCTYKSSNFDSGSMETKNHSATGFKSTIKKYINGKLMEFGASWNKDSGLFL